jgi:hypothetical protein
VLESIVDYAVGNVTNWDVCRDKWKAIEENDSLLHIFGHSDGEKVYLQDPVPGAPVDNLYCLEADRFKGLFGKKRQTRSVTVCFLNGCRTGAGPVGESFLDVLFDRGFQGFVGTEAEVSNEFAVLYAGEFMSRLWYGGLSIRKAFDELREELFPLSLMYSCYAHPDFRIEAAPRATDVEYHRACA